MTKTQHSSHAPNSFALQGGDTQITYSTSSFIGKPQLSYHDTGSTASFSDAQIHTVSTELGTLVTVILALQPGSKQTLTLVLPDINLQGAEAIFDAVGIFTTHRITGSTATPPTGPLELYRVIPLKGTARSVVY